MPWQFLSVLPNLDMQFAVEARECAIVPAHDPRVTELRGEHPNLDTFLKRFRSAHGRAVSPAVMLRDTGAPKSRQTWEAMVALRNCLSVATLLQQHALELSYQRGHRILFSDPFEFYAWSLDRDYDHMMSITPASWAIHQVKKFHGQPDPGSPVHPFRDFELDLPLFASWCSILPGAI